MVESPAPVVAEVDPGDEAALRTWYDTMRAGAVAGRSAPLVYSYESLCASLRHPNPDQRRIPYAATVDTQVVGTVMVELPQRDNQHLAEIDVSVPVAYRRRGYGEALLRHAERVAVGAGRDTAIGESYLPPDRTADTSAAMRFVHRHGYSTEHSEDHLVLDPAAACPPTTGHDGDYRTATWLGACPDRHLDAYAALQTRMEQDVPTGDLDLAPSAWDGDRVRAREARMSQQGYAMLTSVAACVDGSLAGYSELLVPEHEPTDVYQEDTLVMPEHRGHRLGAALKAANLDTLRRRFPDRSRIHTWTADVNDAMYHINAAFGFRIVETLHAVQRRLPVGG